MKYNNKLPNIISGQVNSLSVGDTFIYNKTLYLLTHLDAKASTAEVFDLTNCQKGAIPKSTYCVKVNVSLTVEEIK